ncbi:hypothetical protein CC80DRAFT_415022 [Byssothecium circinans]|uniref:Uncharacterized protein n=1 Tax=Byssothecium circinans TaxID=147558 RepID=A0A6A5TUG0_9PLEO|nr:hypothetical protein CC80DRAFT_415022 [Byssothecium circinans]
MPQLWSMIHGMVTSARRQLMEALMLLQVNEEGSVVPGTTTLPKIYWDRLVDNPAEQKIGWSFIKDAYNIDAINAERWLWSAKRQEVDQRPMAQLQNPESQARYAGYMVKRYLRQVDHFLTLLIVCVHMTSGQPGRGSEVTTMRHQNGLLQDRNIFVMDGQVMTVVRYHKSQSQ